MQFHNTFGLIPSSLAGLRLCRCGYARCSSNAVGGTFDVSTVRRHNVWSGVPLHSSHSECQCSAFEFALVLLLLASGLLDKLPAYG
jgi:hypothetical protein